MRTWLRLLSAILFSATCHGQAPANPSVEPGAAAQLAGLWQARHVFVPEIAGTLRIARNDAGWTGEIAGRTVPVQVRGDRLGFELPGDAGAFLGVLADGRSRIDGHWIQPGTDAAGPFASPVVLRKVAPDDWRGAVTPLETAYTFYLVAKARDDGSVAAFLRNPDRNIGYFQFPVDRLERDGNAVRLIASGRDGKPSRTLLEGRYDPENDRLSVYFPSRGGTYDFRRVGEQEPSDFYPRGRPTSAYAYSPPPREDDGWTTAALEDVGIDRTIITRFIQKLVDMPMDSAGAPEIHGVLIARHGKLVLEEYFHGEHREKAHDTRSAGKSLASDMAGAAMQAGVDLSVSTPVYEVMNGGVVPEGLDARKRAMTLEHLLTMSSGFDCDEDDESSPGYEDNMNVPDVYRATLDLPMVRAPGEKAVYCSVGANLAGGVVARAAVQPSLTLFQRLLADPLDMERYYMGVTPTHDYYLGGGARLLARDFLKLAQLHLNGGTWKGRRVYSADWSRESTAPRVRFSETSKSQYGYLWWLYDIPYGHRTVRAYFASGNGGQLSIGIAELDLAIVFYAGNYNDWETGLVALKEYLPQDILPAVQEGR
jgi:CubicO group peptidase (beta-lactamase class C family)